MDATPQYQERVALAHCLEEARSLERVDQDACARLQTKLDEETFNLVAVGQFKRGKSSVINALLGEALLPVGVVPLTSVITVIRHGSAPALTVVFESGEAREVAIDRLADYVTEKGNPKNTKSVREVLISYPSPWLASGVRLVDTPGIGSAYEHNSDMTMRYVPQADAVLFVGSVDQPMSRAELDFLDSVRPYAGKLFCLLNKIDYLSADEVLETLSFSAHVVHAALGWPAPIYPVSAKLALQEKVDKGGRSPNSGFHEFEQALQRFVSEEKAAVWLQSVARGLLRILSQLRLVVDLELSALAAPIEQINDNLDSFGKKKVRTLREKMDYEALLEADLNRLLKGEVQTSLDRFKHSQKERIPPLISDWVRELPSVSSSQLRAALEERLHAEIRAVYDGWIMSEEPAVARSFEALCARFSTSIQETIDDLSRYSATLFGVRFVAIENVSSWQSESGFSYKFWHEPVGLETLTSSFVLALPSRIGHRLVVARMQKLALDLVEVHAGRIRHDFEQRLNKSCRAFRQQLLGTIDATVAGIERAIENGLAMRQRGEVVAWKRRRELAQQIDRITSLEKRAKDIIEACTG